MCISVWGVGSDQALAATIGPLVEVPVLLSLTWVALYLRQAMKWKPTFSDNACEGVTIPAVSKFLMVLSPVSFLY